MISMSYPQYMTNVQKMLTGIMMGFRVQMSDRLNISQCASWVVCPLLGKVPLTPCFVRGKRTPTLPHSFGNHQGAVADSRNGAGNGSRLYEVNIWMWRYGRGQPRRVTVAEAELQRKAAISDARRRAADTMKRRREERGEDYYRKPAAGDGAA